MLIIGGKSSSNTNKLYNIAARGMLSRSGKDSDSSRYTFLVESKDELPLELFTRNITVGITAGASTPSGIIEEVLKTMADIVKTSEPEFSAEDFAGMLEESLKTLNTGDTVKGTIMSITPNEIHVDLGAKVTGIIPYSEITDTGVSLEETYKVGDEIEAILVRYSDLDGVATLSRRRIESIINWKKVVEAYNEGAILEGKYLDVVKGGIIMQVDANRVFVPASHTGLPKDADLATLSGTTARVKIIEINEQRRRAVASARNVLREERKAKEAEFWANIAEGQEFDGVVKSLTSYGAFVDLGGVDGMVHSSELSWKRIHHPSEVVKVGETIHVFVKSFDAESRRISLGYKTEESNPWNIFTAQYNVGDVVNVKVVSMMPFGAFAEIVPGADGLIHISQLANHKVAKPQDVLEIGQMVDVKITNIDNDTHQISLSIRALLEETEEVAEEAAEEVQE
jgi:4-hydroxy-3-methylbut-2-enyl diphosphate reductase